VPALRCPLCLRAIDSDNDNDNLAGGYTIGEIGGTKELEARWQDKTKSAFSTSMVYAKLIVCLLPTNLNLNRMQGTQQQREEMHWQKSFKQFNIILNLIRGI